MKVVAIIQARIGSTRLPGKVLMPILGRPMLGVLIDRIRKARKVNQIVVATSALERDDLIAEFVLQLDENVKLWRGSEQDVLLRYYEAACDNEARIILRVTGDNPFFCAEVADALITMIKQGYDYAANNLDRRYPYGIDLEAFTFDTLKLAHAHATESYQREHVTPYIRENPSIFRHGSLRLGEDLSALRLTVDSEEDYLRAKRLFEQFGPEVQFKEIAEWEMQNLH